MPSVKVCAFFTSFNGRQVFCQGKPWAFEDKRVTREYMAHFCCSRDWRQCERAKTLLQKYEKEQKNGKRNHEKRKA